MTSLSTANEQATSLATDALDALLLSEDVPSEDIVSAILTAVIPHIRADERERCLEAVRTLPTPLPALYSAGYRAGYAAAVEEALIRIADLPTRVALD